MGGGRGVWGLWQPGLEPEFTAAHPAGIDPQGLWQPWSRFVAALVTLKVCGSLGHPQGLRQPQGVWGVWQPGLDSQQPI